MSVALEVGTYLAGVVGATVGVDMFAGYLPDAPDTLTAVFERPGRPPVRASAKTIVVERPGFQVLTRALDFETAYARAVAAKNALQTFSGTLGTTRYLDISASGAIHGLGTDENKRFIFSINFGIQKGPA